MFSNTSETLDKESKDFEACEYDSSFPQQPLSVRIIFIEVGIENMGDAEGSRTWHHLYNGMSQGLFPPCSQHLPGSQNPQISGTQQLRCFTGIWRAHGWLCRSPRTTGRHHSPERGWGQRCDRMVTKVGSGHGTEVISLILWQQWATTNTPEQLGIMLMSYNATTGLISWPTRTTHCRRYLQYVTKYASRLLELMEGPKSQITARVIKKY